MARGLGIHDSCGPVYWIMVSLLGVHLVPTMLVWCVFGPVHTVWTRESPAAFKLMDILAMGTSLTGIGLQFLSDRTLYNFRRKHMDLTSHDNFETHSCRATCREGLWCFSRHPNYLGEVLFWAGMNFASVAADPSEWLCSLGGVLQYACFFRISASLMDRRSLAHRPGFEQVMLEVSALFPAPLVLDRVLDRWLIPSVRLQRPD